jgi:polyferredoxin
MLPRYLMQAGFLGFYGWLIVQFARWAATLQSATLPAFPRPVAIDGFLPLNGLAGLRYWLSSGEWYPAHAAAAFIVLAALLSALLLKRGFCSWICPVFPLSEGLWRLGEKLMGRTFAPPFWVDLLLRAFKYLLLGFILQRVFSLSFPQLQAYLDSPRHQLADIRLLHFFQFPAVTTVLVIGLLAAACFFIQMAWCRYLCPHGALLGLLSLFSLAGVCRDPRRCIRCGLCSAKCPAWLPVMHKLRVRSPECFACYRCVHNCPAPGAVTLRVAGRLRVPSLLFGIMLLGLFAAMDLYGRVEGRWHDERAPQAIHRQLLELKLE